MFQASTQEYWTQTQTIAPVGWVKERWIHIGVGLTYLSQLGSNPTAAVRRGISGLSRLL